MRRVYARATLEHGTHGQRADHHRAQRVPQRHAQSRGQRELPIPGEPSEWQHWVARWLCLRIAV